MGLSTINAIRKLIETLSIINQELLLKKLKLYGVTCIMLEWFKSYFYNRKQRKELKFLGNSNNT
jgi:hypothetical protein